MRTILLSSGLGHVRRGVEIWMLEMLGHWPAKWGEVELWSGGNVAELSEDPRFVRLSNLSRNHRAIQSRSWSQRYQWEQLSTLPKVLLRLKTHPADIVYCGDPVLTWHLKRFQKWHGASIVFMNGMRLSPVWANHFDGVHLLADPYLEQAKREAGEPLRAHFFVAPHFTDTETFRPPSPPERLAAQKHFNLPEDAFLVLTVGPVGKVSGKRLDFLAKEVSLADPRIHLVHAGGDEDGAADLRREITKLLPARVHFLGPLERRLMPLLYQANDVYSLGALAEPFSIAIIEAEACGLPVVHHHDEITCWVSGRGGRPVSMLNTGEAAAAFTELLNDRAEYVRLQAAAREWAVERYAPDAICDRIGNALRETRQRHLSTANA